MIKSSKRALSNGEVQEFFYDDVTSKMVGTFTAYHKNGKVCEITNYDSNSLKTGSSEFYDEEGSLTHYFNYYKNVLLSSKTFFKSGNIRKENHWIIDNSNDEPKPILVRAVIYFDFKIEDNPAIFKIYEHSKTSGNLVREFEYNNRGSVVKSIHYRVVNGSTQIKSEVYYHDNGIGRTYIRFNTNGKTKTLREFYDNGMLRHEINFNDNEKVNGVVAVFNRDGSLLQISNSINGLLNGYFYVFNNDQTLNSILYYKDGLPESSKDNFIKNLLSDVSFKQKLESYLRKLNNFEEIEQNPFDIPLFKEYVNEKYGKLDFSSNVQIYSFEDVLKTMSKEDLIDLIKNSVASFVNEEIRRKT